MVSLNFLFINLFQFLCLFSYLFNPFSIASCVGQTTTTLSNVILAGSFLFMIKGSERFLFLSFEPNLKIF